MALVRGGTVRPHVQAFADAVSKATGADSFGTYNGHDPTIDRALDIFVPTTSRTLGDAIAAFAIDNLDRFGIWYLIYRQRIYNPQIASYWRDMERRGDPNVFDLTANHYDHVHVSFEESAASQPPPDPDPTPPPIPKEDDMASPFILLTYGSGVALWHPSGDVVPLASAKQVTDALARGDVVMDDLTAEQVATITGAKGALSAGPALADALSPSTDTAADLGCCGDVS